MNEYFGFECTFETNNMLTLRAIEILLRIVFSNTKRDNLVSGRASLKNNINFGNIVAVFLNISYFWIRRVSSKAGKIFALN